MNFTNFTVVIPEHNRPHHLKRLLEYYLDQNVRIIVSDSSVEEFCYLKEYKDKIVYHHFPQTPLAKKIYNILPFIETPYVVMCANDDFVIPNAVSKITDFLDNHLDYNSGQGIYIDYDPFDENLQISLRYPNMLIEQLDENNGCDRLLHLMKSYFQYYYAVYRASTFVNVYSSVIRDDSTRIVNLCLLESYISSYSAIEAKHIIIPELYAARENIINSAGRFTDNMSKIITKKKYRNEYNAYSELLSKLIINQEKITPKKATEIVNKSIDIYMSESFRDYFKFKNRSKRALKNILFKIGLLEVIIKRINKKSNKLKQNIPTYINGLEEWVQIEKYIHKFQDICNKNN